MGKGERQHVGRNRWVIAPSSPATRTSAWSCVAAARITLRPSRLQPGYRQSGEHMSRAKLLLLQVIVALTAVALWHALSTDAYFGVALLPPFFFSTPTDVAARVAKLFASGTIWRHLWVTLTESMLAFAIGATAGVLIGF